MLRVDQLRKLAQTNGRPCVSIYSPTHDSGAEAEGNPIRLKTALQQAEQILREHDVDTKLIERVLAPGWELLENLAPNERQAGTLTLLLADGIAEIIHSPMQTEERVFVSDRFHLKPLLPMLTDDAYFYVLAASQEEVRLLACTRYTQREVDLPPDIPRRVSDVEPPIEPTSTLQFHTARPRPGGGEAAFHSHGQDAQLKRHQLFHFLREVSKGIEKLLDGRSPLVFAGVDELFAIYREANTYEHLADRNISGNPEHVRPEQLRERAWEIVSTQMQQRLADARDRYGELVARGLASDDIRTAATAARDGRVDMVIGATDRVVWGKVPEAGEDVQVHAQPEPWDYDLIDYAAVQTMLHGGTALLVPAERVPGNGSGVTVLLRY